MNVPFLDLHAQYRSIQSEIDDAIKRVLNSVQFIGGQDVPKFEDEFARYVGAKRCVSLNSGTDALILGMRALQYEKGSEILLPANTFYSTALAIVENGLTPVFLDIDESDNGLSLSDLAKKITKKTKAVIAVHLYGQADKIDEIKQIIKDSGQSIDFIEDACQAHGALYKGKKVGTFGVFSAFSFYPGKNLGAYGDGGAIVTNSDEFARKILLSREYGQTEKYHHESIGTNSRLDSIQAAILRVKLKHLDIWNKKRKVLAKHYIELLKDNSNIIIPKIYEDRQSVYHIFSIRTQKRDLLQNYLKEHGVTTLIHYPIPLHEQKAFQYLGYKKGDLPVVEKAAHELLSLPMYPELTEEQQDYVVEQVQSFNK